MLGEAEPQPSPGQDLYSWHSSTLCTLRCWCGSSQAVPTRVPLPHPQHGQGDGPPAHRLCSPSWGAAASRQGGCTPRLVTPSPGRKHPHRTGALSLRCHGQGWPGSSGQLGATRRWVAIGCPDNRPAPGAANPQDHPAHLSPGQGEALPGSLFLADPIKLGEKRGFSCLEPPCLPGALVGAVGSRLQGGGL